jgi:hypothetical protein
MHLREIIQNNQKTDFYAVVFHFAAIWAPLDRTKRYPKAQKWAEHMAECLSLKINSYPNYQAYSFRRNCPKQPENSFLCVFFSPFGGH